MDAFIGRQPNGRYYRFSFISEGITHYSAPAEESDLFPNPDTFHIDGNFCDMFNCGVYSYAVSNLMHLGLGIFKLIRIDKNLKTKTLFDNGDDCFEYIGRVKAGKKHYIVISGGIIHVNKRSGHRDFSKKTVLLMIDEKGTCHIEREWDILLSPTNRIVFLDGSIYLGQNSMVMQLSLTTGEVFFFTEKQYRNAH